MASLWCRWASFLKNEKCVVAISFCPFIWYITRYDFLKFFPRSTMTLSANNKDQGQMLSQPTVLNVPKGLVCYMKFEGCPLKKMWVIDFHIWRDFDFDLICTKIKSPWAVVGVFHPTKYEKYILKTVDANRQKEKLKKFFWGYFHWLMMIYLWILINHQAVAKLEKNMKQELYTEAVCLQSKSSVFYFTLFTLSLLLSK